MWNYLGIQTKIINTYLILWVSNKLWWMTLTYIKGLYSQALTYYLWNYKVGNRLVVAIWKYLLLMEQYLDFGCAFFNLWTQAYTWKKFSEECMTYLYQLEVPMNVWVPKAVFTMWLSLILNSRCPCFCYPSAGNLCMCKFRYLEHIF